MRGKKKLILTVFIILFVFVFNMDSVLGGCAPQLRKYDIEDGKKIEVTYTVVEVGSNNTNQTNILKNTQNAGGGGVFFSSDTKRALSKEQLKVNENNENTVVFFASAVSGHYISTMSYNIKVNDKEVVNFDNDFTQIWCDIMGENEGSTKFNLKVKAYGFSDSDNITIGIRGKTGMNASCAAANTNGFTQAIVGIFTDVCTENKDFAIDMNYSGFLNISNASTKEEAAEIISENKTINTTTSSESNIDSKKVAATTSSASIGAGEGQKLECDESLSSFIKEIWKYFIIFAPILLIVMVTMDFFKALFSSDADLLKKASSNAIKRVVATVILLFLPLVISTILDFFGLELCLWGGK